MFKQLIAIMVCAAALAVPFGTADAFGFKLPGGIKVGGGGGGSKAGVNTPVVAKGPAAATPTVNASPNNYFTGRQSVRCELNVPRNDGTKYYDKVRTGKVYLCEDAVVRNNVVYYRNCFAVKDIDRGDAYFDGLKDNLNVACVAISDVGGTHYIAIGRGVTFSDYSTLILTVTSENNGPKQCAPM